MAYFLENCLLMTVAHQFCDVCGIRLSNTIKILLQLVNIKLVTDQCLFLLFFTNNICFWLIFLSTPEMT